jgi:hypothetical protein
MVHLGVVRCSLSFPNALGHASGFVSLARTRLVCEADASSPRRESSPRRSALLRLILPTETMGSPKFPSHPCESMPRSQTPVVSWTLALAHPGLLPSGHCTPSAFPLYNGRLILGTTTLHISGLHHAACFLVPSSFVRPLLGVHVAFTTDLLARRWSGGICPSRCAPTG